MFEYQIHIKYGSEHGYEHEITESTLKEARKRRQEYRDNCPQYPVKIVRKLVRD